jgi:hypothetical protein
LLHIVDRSDLIWIPPLVQHAKVKAFVDQDFEVIDLLTDGWETAATIGALFEKAFRMVEDGRAEVLLPLQLQGGWIAPWDPADLGWSPPDLRVESVTLWV